jgi:HD-like signal output (HDOD) protein
MKQGILSPQAVKGEVERLDKLCCSPRIAIQIMIFLENPNPSITDLAQWISQDPILTARILKLANSHYYGVSGQISTLNLAIITIGLQSLKELLSGISAIDQFSDAGYVWPEKEKMFWLHSACVGEGARRLSTLVGYPTSGEAFVAGLLHDLGHQVIAQVYPEYFTMISRHACSEGIPRFQAEREILGYDHGQIGSWLAKSWKFPANVITVIEHHHSPLAATENQKLVQLIHLANLICHSMNQNGESGTQKYSSQEGDILLKFKEYFSINGRRLKDFQDLFKLENRKSKLSTLSDISV